MASSSGIPTANILQPGAIAMPNGVTQALVSSLQLLTPQFYKEYTERYPNEDYTTWLSTYGGMEQVFNKPFFWFESRGKNMLAVSTLTQVNTPAAGATVTITVADEYYGTGTQNPIRVGETVRTASSNIEGKVLTLDTTTPGAFVITVRPEIITQAFVSYGSTSLLAGEVLQLAGDTEAGEASDSIVPQAHLDVQVNNTITEIRETWEATDEAEMTQVFYTGGFNGSMPPGGGQAGTSLFTLKGLYKANERFKNNVEFKLIKGNIQNNTGLTNSNGTEGLIAQILDRGESVQTPNIDIAKLHEITRIMDVNGCAKDNLWLQDIYQRQSFSDGIFAEYPAGAWVWGNSENSQEAAVNFGVESMYIDAYMLKVKKYMGYNTEPVYGKTPAIDYFRKFGTISPQGSVPNAKSPTGSMKNVTIMMQQPPKGGTIGNGIRVWQHGGASEKATTGKMVDYVEMICYKSIRARAANQFIIANQPGS